MKTRTIYSVICLGIWLLQTASAQAPGTLKWQFSTGVSEAAGGTIYTSPAIADDGTIYFGAYTGKLYAVNPDGTQKWAYEAPAAISRSSPCIGPDGTIYFGTINHQVLAVRADGSMKWVTVLPAIGTPSINSSPTLGGDGTLYFGSDNKNMYAFNPSGTSKWSLSTSNEVDSSPSIGPDGTIYWGARDNIIRAFAPDGRQKWTFTTQGMMNSSMAVGADGTLYTGAGNQLYAITPEGKIRWQFSARAGSQYPSSPAIGPDGTIYICFSGGGLYAVDATGAQKWVVSTYSASYSSPAVDAEGTIYLGLGPYNISAYNPDGSQKWKFSTRGDSWSSPAITADGTIYFASGNTLYAIYGSGDGLAKSPWPKFHQNNQNTGSMVGPVSPSDPRYFYFISSGSALPLNYDITNQCDQTISLLKCELSNSAFSLLTPLPITITAQSTFPVFISILADSTRLFQSPCRLTYEVGGGEKTSYGQISAGLFIDDGSETAFTGHRALNAYNTSKALDANSPATLNNLSVLYRLLRSAGEATVYNEKALSLALNARYGYAGIKMNQGVIRSDQERGLDAYLSYAEAFADISESSVLLPQIGYNVAWEEYQSDSLTLALNVLDTTLAYSQANTFLRAKAFVLRGAVHSKLGDWQAAQNDFNQAITLDSNGPIGQLARENLATGVSVEPQTLPEEFLLLPNFPNPFNLETRIQFALPRTDWVTIKVYNVKGQKICSLLQEPLPAGWHETIWRGSDDRGRAVGSGIYILRLEAGNSVRTEKISLIK